MTREEKIQKLIDEETGIDNYGSSDYQMGVCDGVRLADKTMLEKVCKWLEENIDAYSKVIIAENSIPTIVLTEDFEFRFKKAMMKG